MMMRKEEGEGGVTMENLHEYETRGWELLNEKPALECDEHSYEKHCKENNRILDRMEGKAHNENGLWAVRRYFIDLYHEGMKSRYYFIDPHGLQDLIQTADLKNGADMAISKNNGAFFIIADGQGYTTSDGKQDIVTTVFECHLLDSKKAVGIKELLGVLAKYDTAYITEEIEAARAFYGDILPLR